MSTFYPGRVLLLALSVAATACTTYKPQDLRAGLSETDVTQLMGQPTGRYSGPQGQTRLEFATGPYGRTTWMVDMDAAGKSIAWAQVLNEASFSNVQLSFQGKDQAWLRYTLGRPGDVRGGGWQGGQVWSWRYPTNECFWYQVSILDSGQLRDGGAYGIDWRCDAGSFGSGGSWSR
ncbi:MAG TPA: hypothetical protein VET87_09650 [Rubrivivax sp.]|nr:hypothetical protein [Rubrivivax sp.]